MKKTVLFLETESIDKHIKHRKYRIMQSRTNNEYSLIF